MSDINPLDHLLDSDNRFALIATVVVGISLLVAGSAGPGSLHTSIAAGLTLAIPLLALRIAGKPALLFMLVSMAGSLLAFRSTQETSLITIPVLLLTRLSYVAAPPVLLDLVLSEGARTRMRLLPVHLYAPAAAMALAVLAQIGLAQSGVSAGEDEIRWAVACYGLCYLALLVAALFFREPATAQTQSAIGRGAELEEQGRYGLASRAYEREGKLALSAETAERAGEWRRAGLLYRRTGNEFKAAEMYSRAEMWSDALDCYESARDFQAAARLCLKMGQVERAVALFEQAGNREAAIKTLEEAGHAPTAQQYRQAGMRQKAAEVFLAAGDWLRAAEVYEHDLLDTARAAELHLANSSFLHAARLLEGLGRAKEAAEAYARVPAGAVDAARLHLAGGRSNEAVEALAKMSAAEIDKIEDEATLTVVARSMLDGGRTDEALKILQGLKRKGASGGAVHLLLGKGLLGKGLTELAEEELRIATSMPLEPADEMKAAYLLGRVLETGQKYDDALQIFHGILQKDLQYADVEARYRKLKALAAAGPAQGS